MEELLEQLLEECRPFTREGKVASYIPELAKSDPAAWASACSAATGGTIRRGTQRSDSPSRAWSSPCCCSWP